MRDEGGGSSVCEARGDDDTGEKTLALCRLEYGSARLAVGCDADGAVVRLFCAGECGGTCSRVGDEGGGGSGAVCADEDGVERSWKGLS